MTALKELVAKVEVGEATHGCFAKAFINDDLDDPSCVDAAIQSHHAFNGSLDNAKALHETVLPEWSAVVRLNGVVDVLHPQERRFDQTLVASTTPARAWLLAILRALIEQENDK